MFRDFPPLPRRLLLAALAAALLTDPELLILDEPTNGLDPSGIIEMRELIIRLNKEHGKTIFLSSHILSEIEKLATDVAIIDQGQILYEGKLEGLQNQGSGYQLTIEVDAVEKAAEVVKELNHTISETNSRSLVVPVAEREQIPTINKALVAAGIDVFQLAASEENLEAIFLNITKKLDQ